MSKSRTGSKKKYRISRRQMREWKRGYAFISLWLIGTCVFFIYTLVFSFRIATSNVYFEGGIQFGRLSHFWDNFTAVFQNSPDYLLALEGFIGSMLIKVPMIVALSLIIAIFLNDQFRGRTFFRMLFFLPVIVATGPVMSSISTSGISIYNVTAFANLLKELPDEIFSVFSDIFSSLVSVLWQSGVQILIFLAGLQKLSSSQYEAARIDGASVWEIFWKITIPNIKPFILLNAIYSIIFLSSDQTVPITYIKDAVNDATKGYSFSIAMAWIYSLVIIAMLIVAYLILRPKKDKVEQYDQKLETVRMQRKHNEERRKENGDGNT